MFVGIMWRHQSDSNQFRVESAITTALNERDKHYEIFCETYAALVAYDTTIHRLREGTGRRRQTRQRQRAGAHWFFDGHPQRRTLAARQSFGGATLQRNRRRV